MSTLCRDCFTTVTRGTRCPACHSPRLLSHPELFDLSIAHIDCDAFYASVEKHDNPELRDVPLIVGGGVRGVVTTCCYIARINGVRSAMPMFKARKLCPDAVIVKPRFDRYVEVSRQIREKFESLTPAVEPLSLDEAFLDLTGTARLHGAPPAVLLARLAKEIEDEIGISVSVGLAHNKFLAKIASDQDKPRGFSVIGKAETADFLARQPVSIIWGVGKVTQNRLHNDGLYKISDVLKIDRKALSERYGDMGERLWHLSRGLDHRRISNRRPVKSVSNETTFNEDIADQELLESHLWRLCMKTSDRLKAKQIEGTTITLKLKRADFRGLTRSATLTMPTNLAEDIYQTGRKMLAGTMGDAPFRLIGIGLSHLSTEGSSPADLLDPTHMQRRQAEKATDAIRARFGPDAIRKGRGFAPRHPDKSES
ncbi:DNA polymerase IV [Paracoccaceae bacterium GXU_MW_L88]